MNNTKTASKAVTTIAILGGELSTGYKTLPIEGWHGLTKAFDFENDGYDVWRISLSYHLDITYWVATYRDECNILFGFCTLEVVEDYFLDIYTDEDKCIYGPYDFSEQEIYELYLKAKEMYE